MRRTLTFYFIPVLCCLFLFINGCSPEPIEPSTEYTGTYATQHRMSAIEYNIFINKQVTVCVNQLVARTILIKGKELPENEKEMASSSKREIEEALKSVEEAYPAVGDDPNRLMTIEIMKKTEQDMENYIEALEAGSNTDEYIDIFSNDMTALEQQAGLYNQ